MEHLKIILNDYPGVNYHIVDSKVSGDGKCCNFTSMYFLFRHSISLHCSYSLVYRTPMHV